MKKQGYAFGLVFLIIGVAVVVMFMVWSARKEALEAKEMQEAISQQEEEVQQLNDAMQNLQQQNEDSYNTLNEQLGY